MRAVFFFCRFLASVEVCAYVLGAGGDLASSRYGGTICLPLLFVICWLFACGWRWTPPRPPIGHTCIDRCKSSVEAMVSVEPPQQ